MSVKLRPRIDDVLHVDRYGHIYRTARSCLFAKHPLKFQWYVWIPHSHRRYNVGKPRDVRPNWRIRLMVWGLFCPMRGRLCYEVMP